MASDKEFKLRMEAMKRMKMKKEQIKKEQIKRQKEWRERNKDILHLLEPGDLDLHYY